MMPQRLRRAPFIVWARNLVLGFATVWYIAQWNVGVVRWR